MMIVGSHGRGAAARLMFGSVSRTIVRHSSCPVTIVRHDAVLAAVAGGVHDPHDLAELW